MKTLKQLAEMIKEKETELAYGSETSVLSGFVSQYDYVDSILSGDTALDVDQDVTQSYDDYKDAYNDLDNS